jgi:hypothetical protein
MVFSFPALGFVFDAGNQNLPQPLRGTPEKIPAEGLQNLRLELLQISPLDRQNF